MKKIFLAIFLLFGCATKTEVVYQTVYPDLPTLNSPLVLSIKSCHFSKPQNDDTIYVGYDKENYKCHLKNQEIIREQILLYENFIQEVNNERNEWKKLNKSLDKK